MHNESCLPGCDQYYHETGRVFVYDSRNDVIMDIAPTDHDDWAVWTEFLDADGELSYISSHEDYTLDAEEFGPIPDDVKGTYRTE
jgi:hypothetical protein